MNRFPSPWKFLGLAALALVSALPAVAQVPAIASYKFIIGNGGISIQVYEKVGPQPTKVPVLLIHGTWGNAQTWDFPGRSVMDYLAVRGYDVYALDLRGEGASGPPAPVDYTKIDIVNRVSDAAAVAAYIQRSTTRTPVVIGWSQGGVIAGILAAAPSTSSFVAGVGLLSVPPDGFVIPPQFLALLPQILSGPSFVPTEPEINSIIFGIDPLTGKSTMSAAAEDTFYAISAPDIDSTKAIGEEVTPAFFAAVLGPVSPSTGLPSGWGRIQVPALVVDGALDPLVGTNLEEQLFGLLTGTNNKQLIVFPRNSHAWFLEDNHDETVRVFDHFLSQF
jgi:pimeloyl-ACP methyl ester carboxylesterase